MNVLSLFDGMSCGQIALERAGIKVDNYFASEIDRYAIKVTQANYPDTVQLGDVKKWQEWELPKIDLLIAGSPCQGFSFAGKQLAFDDPRSKLFFTFVDILKIVKPKYFMLENVRMKKEHQDIISHILGVQPIEINSSLLSAQNRRRLYWVNISGVKQPEDTGVLLMDILESAVDEKYNSDNSKYKGGNQLVHTYKSQSNTIHNPDGKCGTLCANTHGYALGHVPEKYYLSDKAISYITASQRKGKYTFINGEKSACLSAQYDQSKNSTFLCVDSNGRIDSDKTGSLTQRYHKGVEKFGSNPFLRTPDMRFRKLTPVECERLQTVPDNYTNHVSNTQRYKMLGNGWTVDVITHILKGLKCQ